METRKIITDESDIRYALKHLIESDLQAMGNVWLEHRRDGTVLYSGDQGKNTFTTEGMANILNTYFKAATQPAAIYCGLFKNNVVPALADTAAAKLGAAGTYGECQDADYDSPATRATYTIATTATATCTNTASKADFVMATAGGITLYGAFLTTESAKTATTGTLICAKKFTTARAVVDNDEISVVYAITLTTS